MKVAIVILNWNGKSLLERFLPSVVKFSSEANIYVADNASTDDSISFLAESFPTVTIIQNKTNGGYAKGYNDALADLSEDIFVLLNSDVEVTQGWIGAVVSEFAKEPLLAVAQPKILDYNNKKYFEYAGAGGGFLDSLGYPFCRGRIFSSIEKDEGQYNDTIDIFWATGAAFFIRKEAFWKAGGLDEDFFAHQEEIDLCWRVAAKGGLIKYIGSSTVYHVGGATLAAASPRKTFYNFRNTLLMLVKNVKGIKVWKIVFLRLLLDGLAGIQFLFQGKIVHVLAIIRAHFSFYALLPKFLKKRKIYASTLSFSKVKSIVWEYFVKKNRNFNRYD